VDEHVEQRDQHRDDIGENAKPGRLLLATDEINDGGNGDQCRHDEASGDQPDRKPFPHYLITSPIGDVGQQSGSEVGKRKGGQHLMKRSPVGLDCRRRAGLVS
jgi:hypothetical protein